ncbi:MAG: beta-ketoacyl synthase N-terminal-like domain-containing protein, partial [Fusobacteriaceae bacterium]
MRRVVVTGLGMVTALGTDAQTSWEKIKSGETGVTHIEAFDTTDMPVKIAAEIKNFNPIDYGIEKKEIKKLARNTQFAIAATKMALEDANFKITDENAERVGTIV